MVGQDIAFFGHDDPRTQARGGLALRLVAKELAKCRVIQKGVVGDRDLLGGVDVDHGRHGPGGRLTIAVGRNRSASLAQAELPRAGGL